MYAHTLFARAVCGLQIGDFDFFDDKLREFGRLDCLKHCRIMLNCTGQLRDLDARP